MERTKKLNLMLWGAQAVLAAVFAVAGAVRAFMPIDRLNEMFAWPDSGSAPLMRWLGYALLLIAALLMIPRPIPRLVPGTAIIVGLMMTVLCASFVLHGQALRLLLCVGLMALSAFVAWGRAVRVPFAALPAAHPSGRVS